MKLLLSLLIVHSCIERTTTMNTAAPPSLGAAAGGRGPAAPRIAVIGGGAAGLAAARALARRGLRPTLLERDGAVGGVWRRVPGDPARPMYRGLRTNLPKEIMAFRELPFPSDLVPSFVTHEQVLRYLRGYAERFGLEQYVRLHCCVRQVTVLPDEPARGLTRQDWRQIRVDWTVGTGGLNSSDVKAGSGVFDALCIANGHYSLPVVPEVDGLRHFQGRVLHSIEYDEPGEFAGRTVLCVGGRASGSDLAREIAPVARAVYLSDPAAPREAVTEHNVTWVPRTTRIREDGAICFQGSDVVARDVDTIIFCTGYEYQFPFLNAASNLEMQLGGRRVAPLYEQLWHAKAPNIAFLGLPHSILPFPLFELQAEALCSQWLRRWSLPDADELLRSAMLAAQSGGEGKEHGRVPEDTHYLGAAQWDYCRRMAQYAGVYDTNLEDYLMTNKTIYDDVAALRPGSFPAGPDTYRSVAYDRAKVIYSGETWSYSR